MKLDIGAGDNRHEPDYTTVDFYNPKADVKATMWELPFADNSVEAIWAEACLEHIPRAKVAPTLKEWARVLKPTATATISVPDLDFVCLNWLKHPESGFALIFGNQFDEGDFHRCGFNVPLLWSDCEDAGLGIVNIERVFTHEQMMLRALCMKPPEGAEVVRTGYSFVEPDEATKAEYDKILKEKHLG